MTEVPTRSRLAKALVAIAGALLISFALSWRNDTLAVRIRDVIFWDRVSKLHFERAYESAATVPGIGTATDDDAVVENFRLKVEQLGPTLRAPRSSNAAETVATLLEMLPGTGGSGCGSINDLAQKVAAMRHGGYGCCSDFIHSFLALSRVNGLVAREITNRTHSFAEVLDPRTKNWMFVDPQFGLMATNERGEFLSTLALSHAVSASKVIHFVSLKNGVSTADQTRAINLYYSEAAFLEMRVTLGSNVIAQDQFLAKLRFLPKPIRHFVAYSTGRRPRFLGYADSSKQ